ncbi:MAG: hypothetical protein NTY73_04720 [Candidatus Micrarchaeota archaeon]|nr:hypothetical protein [Candidatus Micrarchaeota archaeon]
MANKSVEEVNDEIVKKGGLLTVMYFDIHGNSPEIIQNSMVDMVTRLTHEPGVVYATGSIDEPIEFEGMHSTSAEVTLLARDFNAILNVCFRYGPIGIDVIRPEELKLSVPQLHTILLDISQTSQEYTKFVYGKLMTAEEKEDFNKKLINRAELAKRLVEKGKAAKG